MASKLRLATSNGKKPTPSAVTKANLTIKSQQLLDQILIPRYVQAAPLGHDFNYVAALYCRWRGNSFYFSATYSCPNPNAISPSFDSKFARMVYASSDRYNLSYMRHTGQWFAVASDLTIDQCLKEIKENEIFIP